MSLEHKNIVSIEYPEIEKTNCVAVVISVDGDNIQLQFDHQIMSGKKAFSCLVAPIENDRVAINFDENNAPYVVAILERVTPNSAVLELPAQTLVYCSDQLTLQSQKKTNLISQSIQQISDMHAIKAQEARWDLSKAVIKSNHIQGHLDKVQICATFLSTVAKQAIQKFQNYVRKSEVSDQVQAAQMGRKVDGLYSMSSKHTIMMSKKDTKIDGEHIHMG